MSLIDDVIVKIEKEKGYNEVVKEVVKRLAENNLYVKLEKYKWKIREVGFLGVVIVLKRIKMEQEKVKIVLKYMYVNSTKPPSKCQQIQNL